MGYIHILPHGQEDNQAYHIPPADFGRAHLSHPIFLHGAGHHDAFAAHRFFPAKIRQQAKEGVGEETARKPR